MGGRRWHEVGGSDTLKGTLEADRRARTNRPEGANESAGETAMRVPERVTICEVGTRDGFQIEPDFIPTDQKVEVVDLLAAAGLARIEVTSFVHPKAVPQLRDAEAVMARITRGAGTRYAALVPNEKGAVRAIDARVDAIHTVVSASESHNLANVNMTIDESLEKLGAVVTIAASARVPVVCGISTSFGCPFEGEVTLAQLDRVVGRLVDRGARAIGLADTTGMANPRQIARVFEHMTRRFPGIEWTLHTHDTRAMAIPNIMAAMECGVRNFDASIGGLGGCPFAPGASGNVCTEDLVHALHAMGVATGIDLDRLIAAARRVQDIVGRTLPGQIVKAGKWDRRYPLPDGVAARLPGRT
jgi:hydroxymethylglutaryl-CoA lyase